MKDVTELCGTVNFILSLITTYNSIFHMATGLFQSGLEKANSIMLESVHDGANWMIMSLNVM